MYAVELEKENRKKGEAFSKLVENSVFTGIERDELNRIVNYNFDIKDEKDLNLVSKFGQDLMTGKANEMSDEEILKKYKRK